MQQRLRHFSTKCYSTKRYLATSPHQQLKQYLKLKQSNIGSNVAREINHWSNTGPKYGACYAENPSDFIPDKHKLSGRLSKPLSGLLNNPRKLESIVNKSRYNESSASVLYPPLWEISIFRSFDFALLCFTTITMITVNPNCITRFNLDTKVFLLIHSESVANKWKKCYPSSFQVIFNLFNAGIDFQQCKD